MKTNFRSLCLLLVLIGLGFVARAQLTGTKTIPSTNYPTLKVAIDSLNQYGVGTGGVIITFASTTTEVAPTGGYRLGSATLNASTSATNRVVINGIGSTLTGYTGTSTTTDGIFYIQGTDYVTINNLNLAEAAANTTTTTQMEWGYSLVKLSSTAPFDGCQYVVINGCQISLTKTHSATIGIRAAHSVAASTTILTTTGTTTASANSYNQFTGNNISNVTRGINLVGISSANAVYDKRNVIGGSTAASGNTIQIGGGSNASYGTFTQYDSVIDIRNNTLTINPTQTTTVYMAYLSNGKGDLNVSDNMFNINCAIATTVYGYYNPQLHMDASSGAAASSKHTINNNTFTGTNTLSTTSTFYSIYEYYAYTWNTEINNNKFRDIVWNGNFYCIYNYFTYTPYLQLNDNLMYNISNNYTSGYVYGIYNYNYAVQFGKTNMERNIYRKVTTRYGAYAYYNYTAQTTPPTGYTGHVVIANRNVTDSVDGTLGSTLYMYNYWTYGGFDSSEVNYNQVTNIKGSLTGYTYMYNYVYGYYGQNLYTVKGNRIDSITTFNIGNYNQLGYYTSLCDSNIISNFNCTGTAGYIYNYLGYYGTNYVSSNNRVRNFTTLGAYMYNYFGMYGSNGTCRYNAFTNLNMGGSGGYLYNYFGYNMSNGGDLHHNRIDSISQGTSGTFYPTYVYHTGGAPLKIHDNIISNLTTASTSLGTFYPFYLYTTNAGAQIDFYNNFVTNINYPAAYNTSTNAAVYMPQPGIFNLYHNTIRVSATSTGANFGFTGILYAPTSNIDLRNNIINVNVTPGTTGYTAALRRTSGTANVTPTNYLGTSNANIFYVPTALTAWLYCEGGSSTGMVNAYNITSDPAFNTPCGQFKNFMGHDQASFTENNLIPGSFPATYVPTGTSYAEKGAVPTTAPAVTTDFMNTVRGAVADIGALEFSGTNIDNAPPIISYIPVPVRSYCSSEPNLLVTITDNSGVGNVTGTTAPRLYYKKSSENNAISTAAGGNTSSFNGWKFVEATSVTGSVYSFNFDYSKLTSTVGPGDSITYFVIAQDRATPINAGASIAGFPVCPGSVALTSTHAPINSAPVANGYRILPSTTFVADAYPGSSCGAGSSVITVLPNPVGAAVQWQSATLTGSFSNITGATNTSYSTPINATTLRYRALILCGTATLATSIEDTFVIAAPAILSVTGDTVCGFDTLRLSATVSPFTVAKWYTTSTGGTAFYSGNNYNVPPRLSSVTYYVSANTPNAGMEMVSKTPPVAYTYASYDGAGLEMRFRNAATHFYSTTIYPWNASGSFQIELRDSLDMPTGYITPSIPVSGGAGTTPQVVNLNWKNIPPGRYFLVMTGISGTPSLNMEYNPPGYPFNSPSGNVSILSGRYSTSPYYAFFYYNVVGADCEATTPRTPVTGIVTPPPAISASSPNIPGICTGSSASLSVTSPNPSYVYTWKTIPGSTILSGASHTVTPTSTTIYDLTALDPYTGCINHDTIKINVNPIPNPPTIAPTNPIICSGKSAILIGTTPPGSAGVQTVGTGTVIMSSAPNPFYGFYTGNRSQYLIKSTELFAAGVKPGQLTSLAFQSAATGYRMLNFEIRLANVGTLSAIPSSITCFTGMQLVYQQATFTPPASGWTTFTFPTTFPAFLWTGGDLVVDISNMNCNTCPTTACIDYSTQAQVYGTTMGYQSSVHVYADGNCGVINCPTSGGSLVTSTNRPNMQIGYREPLPLNWLNVTGLYKNASLTSPVSLTDTNTVVYAAPPTTTVYRAVTNAYGCLSAPSLPDTVFVIPSPNVQINPAGPQTICAGAPVTLCIPTGANQVYQWYLNNVAIAGANSNCYVAGAAGSYRVAATNLVTGCADTSIPTVLTVNTAPAVNISANGPLTICNGQNVVLNANSATAVGWQWQLGGANIPGATSSSYTAAVGGVYTVVVANTVGCFTTSAPVTVTINTTPGTVTPQGSTSFCAGGSVVLQGPVGTGLTYQWYDGAGALAGQTSSSYTATTTGNYYVIVNNPSTGCATTSAPIAVTAGAGPNAAITPQGTFAGCQGGSVTLRAVRQPGLCYQWNNGGGAIVGATADTLVVSGAGSYTVTVSICASPACNSTTTTPTVINLNPPPAATVTPSNVAPFCQGDSAVLNANAGPNLSYQWQLGSAPISGATSPSFAAKSNGAYTVVVTNTTTGCTNTSAPVTITVNAAPNSTVTPASNPTFCQGGSVVLNASTTGVSSYQWYQNGNAIPASQGGQASSLTATATGLYTVKVSGSNGCSATSTSTSVQVNALPDVTTVPSGTAAVCQGYTTTLSAVAGPGLTYQWYNGTNPISGATSNTYTTGTAGTYSVKITNTVTTCFATSGNIVLSVNTPPTATASLTGNGTICDGDSVKLNANSSGTGLSYQWKFNGVDIAAASGGTSSVYYAKVAGRYTVAVSNAAFCTTLSNSLVITVNPRPSAYITYNTPLEFCDGSAVVLTANAGTGLTYQWYMNGAPLANTSNVNIAGLSGKYTLKVTNTFQCVNTADTLTVTVYPTPVPTIVRTNSTLATAQPYVSYQWFFNNDPIGGATSATYTFTENGAYKVRVVDDKGCEGFSGQFFVNNVGVAQTAAARSIKVYPNPTTGKVHIESSVKMKMVVRDVTGKSVLEAKEVNEIDLSDMATGMYQLYITDLDGQLLRVEKLTKTDR